VKQRMLHHHCCKQQVGNNDLYRRSRILYVKGVVQKTIITLWKGPCNVSSRQYLFYLDSPLYTLEVYNVLNCGARQQCAYLISINIFFSVTNVIHVRLTVLL